MTEPTKNWRLRDKIWQERLDRIDASESVATVKMSKVTLDKLGAQMNMIGEINTLFGMAVEIDNTQDEDEFEIE